MHYLLAFSGSFLLTITFIHLLPEAFLMPGYKAGLYILIGFFAQMLIQRLTHGTEHGHTHVGHDHHIALAPIFTGLAIHAFMEGMPLGFQYHDPGTIMSLYLAVAAHKLPEAILIGAIVVANKGNRAAFITIVVFSAITPVAAILAVYTNSRYALASEALTVLVPIVAGAFIHIATTIFFESGTKQHMLSKQKILAIALGVGIGLLTLMFE